MHKYHVVQTETNSFITYRLHSYNDSTGCKSREYNPGLLSSTFVDYMYSSKSHGAPLNSSRVCMDVGNAAVPAASLKLSTYH